MNWSELITDVFQVCIIPLLGVLTAYIVKWINIKSKELTSSQDNLLMTKYITMLSETITSCVIATNQTYVESLKNQGKFDIEAQKAAFNQTCNAVMAILSDDAKEYLTNVFGDLQTYIISKIEAEVNAHKLTP